MAYKWLLVVTKEAQEQIDELTSSNRMLVFDKLAELLNADDPTNKSEVTDIKRLKEPKYEGLWRKRAGDWRILYRIEEEKIVHLKVEYNGRLVVASLVNRRDL